MSFLKSMNNKIIKHDLVNKYNYKNIKKIPTIEKITVNISCNTLNLQKFAVNFLALEILTLKKGSLTTSKSANILLKIQKGQPAGGKVILKKKLIYTFLERLIIDIFPKLNNFSGFKVNTDAATFSVKLFENELRIPEFENHYPLFDELPVLDIHITTTAKNRRELEFIAKSVKIPISKITWISGRVV